MELYMNTIICNYNILEQTDITLNKRYMTSHEKSQVWNYIAYHKDYRETFRTYAEHTWLITRPSKTYIPQA